MDRVNIIHHLNIFDDNVNDESSFLSLKLRLQLQVLRSIMKEDKSEYYSRLMNETESLLIFHHSKLEKRMFNCSLVGCLFKCTRHRDYIRHMQSKHQHIGTAFLCQYGLTCNSIFNSFDHLKQHIDQAHVKAKEVIPNPSSSASILPMAIQCRCSINKCHGPSFSNIRELILHLRNYHNGEMIDCIFDNCSKKFDNNNSLRSHINQKHFKLNLCSLKLCNRLEPPSCSLFDEHLEMGRNFDDLTNETYSDSLELDTSNEMNISADAVVESSWEDDTHHFLMAYCDFQNRLTNFQFIPQSTIKIMGDEYLKNYEESNQFKVKVLRESLEKIPKITPQEIQRVIDDVQSNDPFYLAQQKLNTEFKRKEFLKDNFVHVSPVEIVLNPKDVREKNSKKAVVHYIPIIETIKNVVQDPTFLSVVEGREVVQDQSSSLKDVKDGDLYRHNSYFKDNPEAMTLMLYSDAIEVVNPIGAGRGKHKVIQIFFTLGEVPRHLRSRIDRILLVAVFKVLKR